MIQVHQLEGFYRVAQAGSYAAAAREFPYPITQPGVHAQVRKLEEQLGVRLLERIAKSKMSPTRAGLQLLEFCSPFFEQLPDVVAKLQRGAAFGRLRIEAGALEIQELLPTWIRRVRANYPEIEVELRQIDDPNLERLIHDQVDLIVEHQTQVLPGIASRRVGVHYGFLVAPAAASKAGGKRARPDEFDTMPFIAFHTGLSQRTLQLAALGALGLEPARVIGAPSVPCILSFVAAGHGYSLIPWPSRHGPRVRGVQVTPLRGPKARFPISASFRVRRDPDRVLEAVLELAPK
jgi:DNA-binding transcriptional LysR family regulator